MNKTLIVSAMLMLGPAAHGCTTCNKELQDAIYSSTFYPNLLAMMSAFIVLTAIVAVLARVATRRHLRRSGGRLPSPVPLGAAGTVLGIGIGGFIDGIVLHQLLQWHEMLTAKVSPDSLLAKSVNMFWDGVFHGFTLLTTMLGIYLLWKLSRRRDVLHSGHLLLGGMLAGWGLFNLVEGIIDHQLLGLHNVRENASEPAIWNYGFLVLGALQAAGGWLLLRRQDTRHAPARTDATTQA